MKYLPLFIFLLAAPYAHAFGEIHPNGPTVIPQHESCLDNVPGRTCYFKYGRNTDVGSTAEDIWPLGGDYDFVGERTAEKIDCVSSDVDDDGAPADTGARTIFIEGLDANYDPQLEVLIMDGQTPVQSEFTYMRVFRTQNVTAGSTGINEGNITCDGTDSGDVAAYILAGTGSTLQAVYTVPNGKRAVFTNATFSVNKNKDAEIEFFVRPPGADSAWRKGSLINVYQNTIIFGDLTVGVLPARTDIRIRASSVAATAAVSANFMVYLYDD